jgi:SAM-dependent methyltransferase
MDATSREAAMALRTRLQREGVPPAVVRAALDDVAADDRDAWLDLVCKLDEIPADDPRLPRGCVPYLPCPVATILDAMTQAALSADDVFVDVGAGMGRTVLMANLLTSATSVGLEIQPALVHAARERAARLNLTRVRFVEGDAVDSVRSVPDGTVFFLYCPFDAGRLQRVLDDLEDIARTHEIRLCCVDLPPIERPWLAPLPPVSVELAVYRSTRP